MKQKIRPFFITQLISLVDINVNYKYLRLSLGYCFNGQDKHFEDGTMGSMIQEMITFLTLLTQNSKVKKSQNCEI